MNDVNKQAEKKTGSMILFYFNILLVIIGLGLIGGNIYSEVVHGNSVGAGLYAGIVITIYAGIAMHRDNPYKSVSNEQTKPESDSEQS